MVAGLLRVGHERATGVGTAGVVSCRFSCSVGAKNASDANAGGRAVVFDRGSLSLAIHAGSTSQLEAIDVGRSMVGMGSGVLGTRGD